MKERIKIISVLLIITTLITIFSQTMSVIATEYGDGDKTLSLEFNPTSINYSIYNITVNGETYTSRQDVFKTIDGKYTILGKIKSLDESRPQFIYGGDISAYLRTQTIEIRPEVDPTEYSFTIELENIGTATDEHNNIIGFIAFNVEAESQNPVGGPGGGSNTQDYQGNTIATLNYSVNGAVEYEEGPFEGLGINFRINGVPYRPDGNKVNYTEDTAYERDEHGQLILGENGDPIAVKDPETMQPMKEKTSVTVTGDIIHYDSDSDNVNFVFMMNPGTLMTGLRINGQTINNLPRTRAELQACYTDHMLEIEVDNIVKADTYDIVIESRYPNSSEEFMGNFLWDYNPNGYTGLEDKILNATLTFVEAEYNGHKYTTEEEVNALGGIYIWNDAERKNIYTEDREGCGEAQFPVGTKLTVKIIPDAGYQLIDFGINGGVFDPQEEIGTYTFTVQGGPFHLQATIAQVENIVKSKSEKVESGTITLGGTENSMAIGTARLDVDDVTLSQEQITNFEKAAEGYNINDYVDISLFNTVFNGKETSSWDTKVKDLQNDATITLKLEDDVNADDVAIVHETHDGKYEIIQVEYDESTNSVTFKTKSFSNYAIAIKTDKSKKEDNKEKEPEKEYTVSQGDFTVTFSDDAGHEFVLTILEVWNLTDEQLTEFELTKEEYAKAKEELITKVKEYGEILQVYQIDVSDNEHEHNSEISIRIKMKDEMKKYNTFKLVCIDNEEIDSNKDVAELKVDGEYLVGSLKHLSNYALVVKNVETAKENNPKTGDNIIAFIAIFAIAVFGLFVVVKLNRGSKKRKH